MKPIASFVTITKPAPKGKRTASHVPWVAAPLVTSSPKEISRLMVGVLIIGNILQEEWPAKSAILASFKGMAMYQKGNVWNVIMNPNY
jgi:hypothetical protein